MPPALITASRIRRKPAAAVVLDDDDGAGREVGLDEAVQPLRVGDADGEAEVVDAAGQGRGFHHQFDIGVGSQDRLQEPGNQLRVADRKTTHDP